MRKESEQKKKMNAKVSRLEQLMLQMMRHEEHLEKELLEVHQRNKKLQVLAQAKAAQKAVPVKIEHVPQPEPVPVQAPAPVPHVPKVAPKIVERVAKKVPKASVP